MNVMASQQMGRMEEYLHGYSQYLQDTSRWGAWVREPKPGGVNSWIYLGSHLTQRLAARCQDRALLKLEADATMVDITIQLTFNREDYEEDEQLRKTFSCHEFFELLREESAPSNIDLQNSSTTACLQKFMAQEKSLGNLSVMALEGPFFEIELEDQIMTLPEVKETST